MFDQIVIQRWLVVAFAAIPKNEQHNWEMYNSLLSNVLLGQSKNPLIITINIKALDKYADSKFYSQFE